MFFLQGNNEVGCWTLESGGRHQEPWNYLTLFPFSFWSNINIQKFFSLRCRCANFSLLHVLGRNILDLPQYKGNSAYTEFSFVWLDFCSMVVFLHFVSLGSSIIKVDTKNPNPKNRQRSSKWGLGISFL